jgi:bifunctional isochorismate lyase / aryl carrier protein
MTIPKQIDYTLASLTLAPPNAVDWSPEPTRGALLIHDMQDYFLRCYPVGGQLRDTLLAHIQELRAACAARGVPVFYSAQPPVTDRRERGLLFDVWGPGLGAQPEAKEIVAALTPSAEDVVIHKHRYSALHRTNLLEKLRALGRDQLWICGVYAHIGCLMTAGDAFMSDVQPFLIGDAVLDFSASYHQLALDYVARRCGAVISTKQLRQALEAPRSSAASALQASL